MPGISSTTCALLCALALPAAALPPQESRVRPPLDPFTAERLAELRDPSPGWIVADVAMPDVDPARVTASAEEAREIRALIERLQEIDHPLQGLAPTASGVAFSPVPDAPIQGVGGLLLGVSHGARDVEPLTRLVAFGPKALPFLLAALDDARSTGLVVEHQGGFGALWHGLEAQRSSAGEAEARAARAHPGICEQEIDLGAADEGGPHCVTVGDVCFVAIGQITNRAYQAVRYQPTACIVVNSPTARPELAAYVRAVWADVDPGPELARRLLRDFATIGWGAGEIVAGAATRLLYYFPDQAAPVVRARLASLYAAPVEAGSDRTRLHDPHGVRVPALLAALRPFDRGDLAEAQLAVLRRSDDPEVVAAGLGARVVRDHLEETHALALRAARVAPRSDVPYGEHQKLVERALEVFDAPRAVLVAALAHQAPMVRAGVLEAVAEAGRPCPWAVDAIEPLLGDRTETWWTYAIEPGIDERRARVRTCDAAARAIAAHVPGAAFELRGSHADLDRSIDALRRRIGASER